MQYDVIIIGAGPSGLTAGIYAVRSGLKTLIIEGSSIGGLVSLTNEVENFPSYEKISGNELIQRMGNHAKKYCEIKEFEKVGKIDYGEVIKVKTTKAIYETKSLIFATGCEHQHLNVKGEKEFRGKGISNCAECDGFFFKGKKVAVVGGGNSALTEALVLINLGVEVVLIHRRDELRAEKFLQEKFFKTNSQILWNTVVEEIFGENMVKGIKIKNVKTNKIEEFAVDGAFVLIGEVPKSELARSIGVKTDEKGFVIVDSNQRTNLKRVYACGDLTGGVKQIITACAKGCVAGISAYEDIKGNN